MHKHHEEAIKKVTAHFQQEAEVEALLLGGSVAHGYEMENSDIDVMLLVSESEYQTRLQNGDIHYYSNAFCDYEGGYIDGKYLSAGFLEQVAQKGSEPARFAFKDARVLFSRGSPLEPRLEAIVRYPVGKKEERIKRFYAQFEAWNWYAHEALKQNTPYLLWTSIGKLVLFGSRLILVRNKLLYPYHKWLVRVLEDAAEKPSGLLEKMRNLYADPCGEKIREYYELIKDFGDWGAMGAGWPAQFMIDSELNWQTGTTGIDDL
jgi:hypothetical protein